MILERKDIEYITEALVKSSNILKVIYNSRTYTLYVFFHKGKVYSYGPVDNKLFQEFLSSPSKGGFINNRLKKNKDIIVKFEFTITPTELDNLKKLL